MKCDFVGRIRRFAANKNGFDVTLHVSSGQLEDGEVAALAQSSINETEILNVCMESAQSELFDPDGDDGSSDQ